MKQIIKYTYFAGILVFLCGVLGDWHANASELQATDNKRVVKTSQTMRTVPSEDQSTLNVTKNVTVANHSRVIIEIKGMVCSFCAQGIQKSFEAHSAMASVKVNLDTRTVELTVKRFRRISDDDIRAIINDAGYSVKSIRWMFN
jgi:copper chaperone CopZ